MMNLKRTHPVRDTMLVILLVLLVKPALHLSAKRIRAEQGLDQDTFLVHELDQNIMKAFEVTKQQIDQTIILAKKNNDIDVFDELEELSSTLTTIESQYTNNSPALLFLGPLASISIVLKEKELEQELEEITNQLNKMLYKLSDKNYKIKVETNMTTANIKENKNLLRTYKYKKTISA